MRSEAPIDGRAGENDAAGWRFGADDLSTCGSLALLLISAFLLNAFVFPSVALVFPAGRELSTYCGVAFSVIVAVAAYRRPTLLRESAWSFACLGLFAVGLVMLGAGLSTGSPLLVALGSPFGGIGSVWFSVLVGLALINLGAKRSMVVIPTAFVVKYAVQFGVAFVGASLDLVAALLLYFACTALSYLLIRPRVHAMIAAIRVNASPTVLDATNPSSFLPFSSLVYVSIFLFNAACGYAFGSQGQLMTQAATLLSFVPVVVVFFVVVAMRARLSSDTLYQASALLVFAGFLLAPLSFEGVDGPAGFHASSMLLYAGSDCFSVLTYYLIAAVGSRNPAGALSTSAFAFAASWLGIGCGALLVQGIEVLGMLDGGTLLWASAIIAFLFMAYNFVAMKRFSFEDAISGVRPAHPMPVAPAGEAAEEHDAPRLDASCDAVISRFGLTPREGDVLRLLARGRTSPVIQEKLFLSHNTVKTHVRHIYAKLDIHSQQELIDIVEGADA
jgi:DNA-binding CsgD family transcriptional regulator